MRHYAVLDLETSGLDEKRNAVVQIAFVILDQKTFVELDRYNALVKPYIEVNDTSYDKKALEYNNRSVEELMEKGKDLQTVVNEVAAMFDKHKTGKGRASSNSKYWPIIVGHNAADFDRRFLFMMFRAAGKRLYDHCQMHIADTQRMMEDIFPDLPSVKLGVCCETLGFEISSAHDAMADVLATAELFKRLTTMSRNAATGEASTLESGQVSGGYKRNYVFDF